jgi:hypothetical protein
VICRTLLVSKDGLEHAKSLIASYKLGKIQQMNSELWQAKKVVDSTLHPGTLVFEGEQPQILIEYRYWRTGLPAFQDVLLRLVKLDRHCRHAHARTSGTHAQPNPPNSRANNYKTTGTLLWQITNQSLNVAINNANANKSTPLSVTQITQSYLLAVTASCSVALGLNALVPRLKRVSPSTKTILSRLVPFAAVASAGALNVFLMRGEEIRKGIDVYPVLSEAAKAKLAAEGKSENEVQSLGKSKKAATLAVSETALSRVLNSSPIMVIPPLILVRLQRMEWLKRSPRLVLPINLGLILTTSLVALPLALGAFPQRQAVRDSSLEEEFWGKGGEGGMVAFNRGI